MRHGIIGHFASFAVALAVSMTGAVAQQAKMYGTVVDDQGAPVANAKVVLDPIEQGSRVEVATKGKKGSYLIGIIRPGTYALKVDATGMVIVSLKAKAMNYAKDRKEPVWNRDGRVRADEPPKFQIEDGMEITCDVVVGHGTEVTTASGSTALATPDQALAVLTQQVQKGDCAAALPQLEKFTADNPSIGRGFYLTGYCNAVLEHNEAAIAALTKAKELEPAFAGTETLIGKIYMRTGNKSEAEAAFRKELENASAPAEVQADALISLGALLKDEGKDQDAVAVFEKAKALTPSRPEPYFELSALYAKLGQTDKAAAVLDEAKQVGADDPVALLNVGISYFNKKDYAHAETMFRRVTESKASNSDLALAYGLLGKLQLRDGKNDEAVASFKKCLELDPNGRLAAETNDVLKALKKK